MYLDFLLYLSLSSILLKLNGFDPSTCNLIIEGVHFELNDEVILIREQRECPRDGQIWRVELIEPLGEKETVMGREIGWDG